MVQDVPLQLDEPAVQIVAAEPVLQRRQQNPDRLQRRVPGDLAQLGVQAGMTLRDPAFGLADALRDSAGLRRDRLALRLGHLLEGHRLAFRVDRRDHRALLTGEHAEPGLARRRADLGHGRLCLLRQPALYRLDPRLIRVALEGLAQRAPQVRDKPRHGVAQGAPGAGLEAIGFRAMRSGEIVKIDPIVDRIAGLQHFGQIGPGLRQATRSVRPQHEDVEPGAGHGHAEVQGFLGATMARQVEDRRRLARAPLEARDVQSVGFDDARGHAVSSPNTRPFSLGFDVGS
jgi:hypothetical protein